MWPRKRATSCQRPQRLDAFETAVLPLDFHTLSALRAQHPAWRLLAAEHAPLVASFLHRVFIVPNVRVMPQSSVVEALEDTLFGLRERLGEQAHANATGISQFCRRYGFQDKPLRVRFRWLGQAGQGVYGDNPLSDLDGTAWSGLWGTDLTVTQTAFERLNLPVQRVFITENEVNFLAFPAMPSSLVVFGAGYGFDALAAVRWLQGCALYHWGDIDTHGFAILDHLRAYLPHAQSLLMDEATFMAHQAHWGHEPQPVGCELPRLNLAEATLYRALHSNQWGNSLRLEQEHVGFAWVQRALAVLDGHSPTVTEKHDV